MRESVTLKITSADTMTLQERKAIANWLTDQAHALVIEGKDYDRVYTGRYYTDDEKDR